MKKQTAKPDPKASPAPKNPKASPAPPKKEAKKSEDPLMSSKGTYKIIDPPAESIHSQ